jgi:hypothetical protein
MQQINFERIKRIVPARGLLGLFRNPASGTSASPVNASAERVSMERAAPFSDARLTPGLYPIQSLLASPAIVLLACVLLSGWFYWSAFVDQASLLDHFKTPGLDSSFLYGLGIPGLWHFILSFLALAVLYGLAWRAAQRASCWPAWLIVLGGSLALGAILLYMAPFDSTDIYDNIVHGRILGLYNGNPFTQVGAHYSYKEPFVAFMGWARSPSAYGPVWEMLAGVTAILAGKDMVATMIAFKLLPGVFTLSSAVVVALILRRVAPEHALAGTLLLAWNPVVLYETWGNGHNDMAMVFWVLLAALALVYARYSLAILSLVCGVLIKYIPVLVLPAAGMVALYHLRSWRARLGFLVVSGLGSLALVFLSLSPYWHGLKTLTIQRRQSLFTASVPSTLFNALDVYRPELNAAEVAKMISLAAFGLTVLFALAQALRAGRGQPWERFTQSAFNVLVFYLLITNLWFQQWYVLWLIGLAPLLQGRARYLAILFGFTSLAKQFIVAPLLFWDGPRFEQPWSELWFTLGSLGIPLAYTVYALLAGWLKPQWSLNIERIVNTKATKVNTKDTKIIN